VRGMYCVRIGLLAVSWVGFASCVGPPLVITPTALPNAVEDQPYTENLDTGETRSLEWDVSAGVLPPGIVLDSATGVLDGTPTLAGTYDFTVSVVEALPRRTGSRSYSLEVLPLLTIKFQPTPARVNVPYEYTPLIEGGVPPYAVSVTGLPGGLSSDPTTGKISGTPHAVNEGLRLVLAVTDDGDPQQGDSKSATLVIHPLAVSIATAELPAAPVNEAYRAELDVTDGLGPFTWRVSAGTLPAGLRLNVSSGEITGAATARATTETFTIAVTDSDTPASTDSRELKIVVPVIITTTALPDGHADQAYDESIGVAAGLEPYTWQISAGALPAGLVLDASTGVVSGKPGASTAGQTFDFTVHVTDSDTPPTSAVQDLSIEILP
jgi:hypothetical protein